MKKKSKASQAQSERDRLAHESAEDYGTPYKSSSDWSLANRENPSKIEEVKSYSEDYSGDEDFYGDDAENQSGHASYTGSQSDYVGKAEWVDERYGEHQFSNAKPKSK